MGKTLQKSMAALMFALFAPALASAQESVPYSAEFDGNQADWTIVDKSETVGRSWSQWSSYNFGGELGNKPCVMMQDEYYAAPNDYYVSPAIQVEAGKTYAVTLHGFQQYSSFHGTLTAEVGTDKDDMSTFKVIGTHEPETSDNAEFNDVYKFTAESTGTIYVAFHATEYPGMDKYVYYYMFGMSIEESTADPVDPGQPGGGENPDQPDVETEALPYYQNFVFQTDKWKAVDASANPGDGWDYRQKFTTDEGYSYWIALDEDDGGGNDYYISPAFKLEAGKTYTADFSHAAYTYGGTLYLEIGTDRDDVSTFTKLYTAQRQTDSGSDSHKLEDLHDFTVDKDGVYYLALHATNEGAEDAKYVYVLLKDFLLKEKEGGGENPPAEDDITKDEPAALPYSVDFSQDDAYTAWRTLDASSTTGSTWAQNSYGYMEFDDSGNQVGDAHPCASITTDWDSEVNDYFISPVFNFEEGKTYLVKVHAAGISGNTAGLTLELASDRRDANTYVYEGSVDVPVEYSSESQDKTFEVEINKDGRYYLALHARGWEKAATTSVNIFSFSVEEKAEEEDLAVALPYTADFTKASDTENGEWETWTKLDRSDYASSTWNWGDGSFITFDENYNAGPTSLGSYNISYDNSNFNDYLVSPAMYLEAGKTYVVTSQVFTREYSDLRTLSLELGTEKKVAASYNKVGDIDMNVALLESEYQALKDVVSTNEVTVDQDGKYYFAIHGAADEGKSVYAYVLNFSVVDKDAETGIGCVGNLVADPASTAVYTLDGRRAANITSLPKGTYIVKTKDASGNVKTVKVMK